MIKIVRSPCGSWHWVSPRNLDLKRRVQCSVHKDPLSRSDFVWTELDLADLRIVLRDLYVPKKNRYGGARLIASSSGRFPMVDGVHFCTNCLSMLFSQFHKETEMKCLDLTKPIVVCSDGSVVQADSKTLAAAKKLAKEIVEGDQLTAVVFKPHTQYNRKPPPVVETKL